MSYTQSKLFTEGRPRHEEPEEKLWRTVITLAAQEAKKDPRAAAFFSSEGWKIVSREMLSAASIQKMERAFARPVVALETRIRLDQPLLTRAYTKPNWADSPKAVAARDRYRAKRAARQEAAAEKERVRQEKAASKLTPEQKQARRRETMRNYEQRLEQNRPDVVAARAEAKKVRERERYRTRTGFYDRQGLPTSQESAPCPVS